MMKKIIIGSSIVLAIMMVGGAVFLAGRRKSGQATSDKAAVISTQSRTVSKAALAAADGKNGHDCLVAVDGMVYKIENKPLWQNGEHVTSEGQAYCGADMTAAIDKSPHGRSKLAELEKIGPLGN
jgi:predicted heme/steroid binding protein